MESLQGSFNNPCFLGEHLNVECLEEGDAADFSYGQFLNKESLSFGEPFSNHTIIFQDKMPFLQMLEGVESPSLSPLPDPNFHLLPRIQHQKKPWKQPRCLETDARIPPLELESCVTYLSESHSPIKSETKDQQYPHSSSCLETPSSPDNFKDGSGGVSGNSGSSSTRFWKQANAPQFTKPPPVQEKRKRKKRSRPSKNSEEVESQRMTHIAVERNRRKQMNDHLNVLRSLMPPSFIQRGDQASIVGGAIDFVKELEQLLQSLQVQKRLRLVEEEGYSPDTPTSTAFNGFFTSPQYTTYSAAAMRQQHQSKLKYPFNGFMEGGVSEFSAENKSAVADIEVMVIQTHVNLKILSRRRPGQLVKAIAALEELYLDILHLNVTSLESSVLYSFNLKIEEGCSLGSADEIAGAVYQIFNFINGN